MIAQWKKTGLAVALAMSCSASAMTVAYATPPGVGDLIGTSWTGSGQVRFEGGQTESLKCKAYYARRPIGMSLALRCASVSQSIDLRAVLVITGSQVNGSWEERAFNASGIATGTSSGNRLSLIIDGGGLRANMAVTTVGTSQTVSITSEGTRLRAVTIGLAKDAP